MTKDSFSRLEFHRAGVGLLVEVQRGRRAQAVFVSRSAGDGDALVHCSCGQGRKGRACPHIEALREQVDECHAAWGARRFGPLFEASLWFRLAKLFNAVRRLAPGDVRAESATVDGEPVYRIVGNGDLYLVCQMPGTLGGRLLLDRCGLLSGEISEGRAALLTELRLAQATPVELAMNKAGAKTDRQTFEEGIWHTLAYHAYRELGREEGSFHPAIDLSTGEFCLSFRVASVEAIRIGVPRAAVAEVMALLRREFPAQPDLAVHPIPLRSLFRVTKETELDVEVRPFIEALQATGESRYFARAEVERFVYGRLVFLPEMRVLAELESGQQERRFVAPEKMILARSQLPALVERLEGVAPVVGQGLETMRIVRAFRSVSLRPTASAPGGAFWVNARYSFDEGSVTLAELVRARQTGMKHVEVGGAFIELEALSLAHVMRLADDLGPQQVREETVCLGSRDIFRLLDARETEIEVLGKTASAQRVERILALAPGRRIGPPRGLVSTLRTYQTLALEWLVFLFENGLSGLLCDEMGLGKTHQAMALMLSLVEELGEQGPFLVVCPTSVLCHWDKLRAFAPDLEPVLFHGAGRTVPPRGSRPQVHLTSYGILRNDIETLSSAGYVLAVLDEIQQVKNPDTLGHEAAARLPAKMKLGLTGTPIENSVGDLRALVDLVLPGYLEGPRAFDLRHGPGSGGAGREALKRRLAPFVLRRLKSAVLDELPDKIEDVRHCSLSDEQARLYREVLDTRARPLREALASESASVPYIHVFALLTLLKRICDHPALVLERMDDPFASGSGKWDLFLELVSEALDSGQKVVVFSQFLEMIALMERHFSAHGVGHVTLTGKSKDRGRIVARFNEDEDCRVFLGSLKAGGTGIDLVAGSVVIHYDRWWNAAREDQATDRAHRIGQKRAVSVFKLVTQGTLEERIDRIISEKRRLLGAVVEADDPHLSKLYSREQLLALLAPVAGTA
jgi:superfamily II DNA or RNA helicase